MATSRGLHTHAFWLYGVIVGLAVKAALEIVVPHLYSLPSDRMWDYSLETARLVVFLIVIVRFYLGSAHYFDKTYGGGGAEAGDLDVSYAIDFLFGFIHFLLFYAWALSIQVQGRDHRIFPCLMAAVLLYDVVWYLMGSGQGSRHLIRVWAFLNSATVLAMVAFYYSARDVFKLSKPTAEAAAFFPVVIISLVDISEVILGKRIMERTIRWVFEGYFRREKVVEDRREGDGPS